MGVDIWSCLYDSRGPIKPEQPLDELTDKNIKPGNLLIAAEGNQVVESNK